MSKVRNVFDEVFEATGIRLRMGDAGLEVADAAVLDEAVNRLRLGLEAARDAWQALPPAAQNYTVTVTFGPARGEG